MGKYDEITESELRAELTRFARVLLEMEEMGQLPREGARLLGWIGELRQMLFAWEVRHTRRPEAREDRGPPHAEVEAVPGEAGDRKSDESLRIVREAIERELELLRELGTDDLDDSDSKDD